MATVTCNFATDSERWQIDYREPIQLLERRTFVDDANAVCDFLEGLRREYASELYGYADLLRDLLLAARELAQYIRCNELYPNEAKAVAEDLQRFMAESERCREKVVDALCSAELDLDISRGDVMPLPVARQ